MIKIKNKWILLQIQGTKLGKKIWKASHISLNLEATLQMCYYKKVLLKYTANLQCNTHVELRFQ